MQAVDISVGVNGNGLDTHLLGGPDDTASNLSSVCNQDLVKGLLYRSCPSDHEGECISCLLMSGTRRENKKKIRFEDEHLIGKDYLSILRVILLGLEVLGDSGGGSGGGSRVKEALAGGGEGADPATGGAGDGRSEREGHYVMSEGKVREEEEGEWREREGMEMKEEGDG